MFVAGNRKRIWSWKEVSLVNIIWLLGHSSTSSRMGLGLGFCGLG